MQSSQSHAIWRCHKLLPHVIQTPSFLAPPTKYMHVNFPNDKALPYIHYYQDPLIVLIPLVLPTVKTKKPIILNFNDSIKNLFQNVNKR